MSQLWALLVDNFQQRITFYPARIIIAEGYLRLSHISIHNVEFKHELGSVIPSRLYQNLDCSIFFPTSFETFRNFVMMKLEGIH
jgi:hypothetical protein